MRLSIVVVAHNEAHQLAACLSSVTWADEIVVVLDRCTDDSAAVARPFASRIVEGAWPLEGPRRHAGIDVTAGPWVFELDADERVTPELAAELQRLVRADPPFDYALVPLDNYIGRTRVRYGWGGSFGTSAVLRLYRKGAKHWGDERVHPKVRFTGKRGPDLSQRLLHYVDRDVSDVIARLNRYSSARAADMRERGDRGSIPGDLRRLGSRFFRCYVRRKGYREGGYGLLIGLMAGLFPLLSTLKARLDDDEPVDGILPAPEAPVLSVTDEPSKARKVGCD